MSDKKAFPEHVAIILDGNGRWARERGRERTYGHQVGAANVKTIVRAAGHMGIKVLTLYAFSTENWKRPSLEVRFLMKLFKNYLISQLKELVEDNVQVHIVGDTSVLSEGLRKGIAECERDTARNNGMVLNVAINYGGRMEIVHAMREIAEKVERGEIDPSTISEDTVKAHLYPSDAMDVDLLIRTGGESRISNFLLWQASYSELYFTPVLWPDFTKEELEKAVDWYTGRGPPGGGGGPTPVSALIHAATMVVAGVYLVARLFPVYYFQTPEVLVGIAVVGAFTSLFAAVIACVQTDIKRVLAFSTISQIGFMMVALGVSGYGGHHGLGYMASMFHLFTHAMFKALLFLGAGAIIHAVHSNEMSHMGGLRKQMPITHITFLIACLAIAGIPPFSGFFSKDEILTAAFEFSPVMGWVMTFIAALTAFYMFRLYFRIFWGNPAEHEHEPHEAPASMTTPLIILAAITCVAGFIPFGKFVSSDSAEYIIHLDTTVAITSVVIACLSIGIATWFYRRQNPIPGKLESSMKGLHTAAYHRFYIDEVYQFITHKIIFGGICSGIAWFDRHVVDGSLNGLAAVTQRLSLAIRGLQSGQLQWYAYVFLIGTLVLTLLIVFC